MTSMLTAEDAAERLGIKVSSLYAYVSRGLVERHTAEDGRSWFEERAIATLAARGRPRLSSRETSINLLIETELTRIDSHRIFFRGHDATELAVHHSFEEVAELLWRGTLAASPAPWHASPVVGSGPPSQLASLTLGDRLRVAVASAGSADPLRANLDPESVAGAGRNAIATMVAALADRAPAPIPRLRLDDSTRQRSIAARLSVALAGRRRLPGAVEVLNTALVLLADHELAASTLAGRVAASARADPYAVIGTGLGVLNGPLHGRASSAARRLLDDAAEKGPSAAITEALHAWRAVPGFGHPLYPNGDPRATLLLRRTHELFGQDRSLAVVDAVIDAVRSRADVHPNVDLALAAVTHAARMPTDAGEVIFAIARSAGWLAHALEEYTQPPLRFRPRAAYVGPR